MSHCYEFVPLSLDFNVCRSRNNYLEYRGERNGLRRREKRPKKDREEGENKQNNRETGEQHKKGGRRMFFKKM